MCSGCDEDCRDNFIAGWRVRIERICSPPAMQLGRAGHRTRSWRWRRREHGLRRRWWLRIRWRMIAFDGRSPRRLMLPLLGHADGALAQLAHPAVHENSLRISARLKRLHSAMVHELRTSMSTCRRHWRDDTVKGSTLLLQK